MKYLQFQSQVTVLQLNFLHFNPNIYVLHLIFKTVKRTDGFIMFLKRNSFYLQSLLIKIQILTIQNVEFLYYTNILPNSSYEGWELLNIFEQSTTDDFGGIRTEETPEYKSVAFTSFLTADFVRNFRR
jgi:hypothetical protein